ncbi:hypothetical protein PLICRDRAFT_41395 [Plicaturopsis crispa FD-325 SS-3]|nr:hypothetical protein PLICRDRAFT_41395 [Plicaturopsis crispa FD-325 SS-3]
MQVQAAQNPSTALLENTKLAPQHVTYLCDIAAVLLRASICTASPRQAAMPRSDYTVALTSPLRASKTASPPSSIVTST